MKRLWLGAIAVAALAVLLAIPTARRWLEAPPPHVILISIDTLRADHLGCYGYQRPTSPVLDELARGGVRFARAFSQASWTLPSHMSVMTSQYPHVHGVQDDDFKLGDAATTLAEAFSGAGYETAAFVSWLYVSRAFGFGQGFREFSPLIDRSELHLGAGGGSYHAARVTDAVLPWVQREHNKPFFLFVHYFDPHMNYSPPAEYAQLFDPDYDGEANGDYDWVKPYIARLVEKPEKIDPRDQRHIEALYDAEIRYVDHEIGRLLDAIDDRVGLENCVVAVMSDHGEEFNDHGSMEGHGWTLYDEILHVPLILRIGSKPRAGRVVEPPVQLIDIAPTLLRLADIAVPAPFQGRDLLPLIDGKVAETPPIFASSVRFNIVQRAVRGPHYKLIHTEDTGKNEFGVPIRAGFELFRVDEDPRESKNLYQTEPDVARRMGAVLIERMAARPGASATPGRAQVSDQDRKLLESLGYLR